MSMATKKLGWGILGTGSIAKTFVKGLMKSQTGVLVAVGSRAQESADKFGADFLGEAGKGVARHASYEALLADANVQAVYIATPHTLHAHWAIRAAEAGKHILCEKPLTLNYGQAMTVVNAAREHKVFLMEAYMYRCHPVTAKIIELIKSKVIGEVRAIQTNFSFHWPKPLNTTSRLTNNALGGGGILDVGGYCTTMVRMIAGAAVGHDFVEPVEVKATAHIGDASRVDEYSFATMKFPGEGGGIVATLGTGVQCNMENWVKVYGSAGRIDIPWMWIPAETGIKIMVHQDGVKDPQIIETPADANVYTLEADTVARAVAAGRLEAAAPAMTWADTLGNMKALDRWRESIGMRYDEEAPEKMPPVSGRTPVARADALMKFGQIAGVDKPVARLIFGVDKWGMAAAPPAFAMMDDYIERGGNTFDCARVYGQNEQVLGTWVKTRNIREKIVLLDKGAHTPNCTPEGIIREHKESLSRLNTNYVDIYMMHRDNLEVPIGEFVTALNELKTTGTVRAFGGSNWTPERVDLFNVYAERRGLAKFCGTSNNFSLARMIEAPWGGCLASSGPEVKAWHIKTQMPNFSWSSQARGFFVHGDPRHTADRDLVRCWYSEDNFQRLARAKELAAKRGVTPLQIALAYVLYQAFPQFALIGPYSIEETRTSIEALKVELSAGEVKWLNLEM